MNSPVGSNGLPSPWTDERIELLKKLWAEGYVAPFIAMQLGGSITKNGVVGKALRLRLEKRRTGVRTPRSAYIPAYKPRPVKAPTGPKPFLGIELQDLKPAHCRFPQGEGPYFFCGQPKKPGSSYCPHHHKITHGYTAAPFASAA